MLVERAKKVFEEPPISTCSNDVLLARVSFLLRQTYVLVGFKLPEPNDLGIITSKLASDLFESFPTLTLGEVSLCFELGAKGEYGDFMGLNLRTFNRWLKAYKTSDFRYRLVVDRSRQQQAALPPISEAYNQACEEQMLQNVFRYYCRQYPIDQLMPVRVYQALQKRGVIADSPADKRAAMEHFARWKPDGTLPMDEDTRKFFIKNKAMTMLLQRYFDRLVREGAGKLPL